MYSRVAASPRHHRATCRSCSERKQKEISEVLMKVDIVAGQETWERKNKVVSVDGYKWFGASY